MANNTSIINRTITCPVCGAQAHGLVVKGSGIAELIGCDACIEVRKAHEVAGKLRKPAPGEEYYDYRCPVGGHPLRADSEVFLQGGRVIGCGGGVEDDGCEYCYYPVERESPYAPDDYSLATPYDAVLERVDSLKLCPVCGKPCDTITIDYNGDPVGCSHCAPEEEAPGDDTADYDALEAMYLDGFDVRRCYTEAYNRWRIAKRREEEIVTGKAGRPLISGWDKDGQGNLYDI